MTDDIVTRLRLENYPLLQFGNHQDWCTALGIMDEAADEIERLRYEVARWKQLAKNDVVMCDPNDPCEMCKELAAQDD